MIDDRVRASQATMPREGRDSLARKGVNILLYYCYNNSQPYYKQKIN